MRVRAARHEILSANIANADTPGFCPEDVDFNSLMKIAADEKETQRVVNGAATILPEKII